jgi:hypothetical protein
MGSRPPWGPPLTSSSNSVVAAAGPADSAPRGPTMDVFLNLSGGRCWTHRQCLKGPRHRRLLQTRWWPLTDSPTVPPGGALSTSSSTLVVAAAGPTCSTPRGARHRHLLQPRWWLLPDPLAVPPRGPAIDIFINLGGGRCWTRRQRP